MGFIRRTLCVESFFDLFFPAILNLQYDSWYFYRMLKSFLAKLFSTPPIGQKVQIPRSVPILRAKPFTMSDKFLCPVARGIKELDRSVFQKDVKLLVAKLPNPRYVGEFVKVCKNELLNIPNVKHIVPIDDVKGVLLRDDIDDPDTYQTFLPDEALDLIKKQNIEIKPYTLKLDYHFWKADDILQAILPEDLIQESPSGYAQAGHIAHLNLRNEFKPYGSLIGQVILDKNPTIKTVVDKLDTISNKYRVFDMKLIAGEDNFMTEQHESGCKFRFDFSTAFWNSRLNTEHERLIGQFKPGDVVADVFAGVGPFAIPAGKKNVLVLANDLNPESHKFLTGNAELNNVLAFVKGFNLDGREFIRRSPEFLLDWKKGDGKVEQRKTLKKRKTNSKGLDGAQTKIFEVTETPIPSFISNYVMNLPGTSIEFLNEFVGLYSRNLDVENLVRADENFRLPTINVHCFEKFSHDAPEPTLDELHRRVHARIIEQINFELPILEFNFHMVRKVAPTKPMFCVSFVLPEEVAFKK